MPPQPSEDKDYSPSPAEYMLTIACYAHPRKMVDQKIGTQMGAAFPTLSQILTSDDPNLDPKVVRPLLQSLLEAAKSAPAETKPDLLLAADAVAERLVLPSRPSASPDLQRELDGLTAEGLTFSWAEMDGDWFYQNDLLWRIWREYPSSQAAGDALVLLLRLGWTGKPCCDPTLNPFRAVIQHGEDFLAKQPSTPHRQDILFLLAQAYETWWSLSLGPEENREEGDPSPALYRDGAALAREKAIAYYGEIVAAAPESVEAQCSRKPFELLKANQDTHQRRFICYCD